MHTARSPRPHRTIRNSQCHGLLDKLGLKRSDVEPLGTPALHGRELLMSETMRPSNATAQWHRRLEEPEVVEKIAAGMQISR